MSTSMTRRGNKINVFCAWEIGSIGINIHIHKPMTEQVGLDLTPAEARKLAAELLAAVEDYEQLERDVAELEP